MASIADKQRTYASKTGIWGWMLFDWAAQPFFTVVTTFIFGPYFISRMAPNAETGQIVWGYGIAVAGLLIAVLSPLLGSIADQTGYRKRWIGFFAVIKIIGLLALWFAVPGANLLAVMAVFSIIMIAAEFSIVFNDSMMPRLVPREQIGYVSNLAWGLGYLGGMIVLPFVILCLAGNPDTGKTIIGIAPLWGLDATLGEDARITGPIAAIWYLLFIIPMFVFTPDTDSGVPLGQAIKSGMSELKATLHEIVQRKGIMKFLIARMVYQDGVNALLALGGGYAAAMFGWSIVEIGLFGMILNVVAIIGCLIAGRIDKRYGAKIVVTVALFLLLVATLGIISTGKGYTLFGLLRFSGGESDGLFSSPAEHAYLIYGLLIGLAFGPVQASSRSWFAQSISPEESGRYFGIYALAGRATSFIAPFAVATITALTASATLGMATLVIFFIIGLLLIHFTPFPANHI